MFWFYALLVLIVLGVTIFTLHRVLHGSTEPAIQVTVPKEAWIPMSVASIEAAGLALLPPGDQPAVRAVLTALETAIRQNEHKRLSSILRLYEPFAPGSDTGKLSPEELTSRQSEFVNAVAGLFARAGYSRLSPAAMTFALQESYASSVPLRPKWEQLDSSLLPPGEENWQQHIWLFHRGVGSEKQKQYFPLQKLDMLIVSFASLVFRRAPAAPAAPPVDSITLPRASLDQAYASRRARGRTSFFRFLFGPVSLVEPTYREVVLLYRPRAKPRTLDRVRAGLLAATHARRTANPRLIELASFWNVPMADLETILPALSFLLPPFAVLRFALTALVAILAAALRDTSVSHVAWTATVALALKVFFDYRSLTARYRREVDATLYSRVQARQHAVLTQTAEEAAMQAYKQAALAYCLLLARPSHCDVDALRSDAAKLLTELDPDSAVLFDAATALGDLKSFGLADGPTILQPRIDSQSESNEGEAETALGPVVNLPVSPSDLMDDSESSKEKKAKRDRKREKEKKEKEKEERREREREEKEKKERKERREREREEKEKEKEKKRKASKTHRRTGSGENRDSDGESKKK